MGILKRTAARRYAEAGWTQLHLLDEATCRWARGTFLDEVKPHRGSLRRQLTSVDEVHQLSVDGHVTNPVVNPHLCTGFPTFSTLERTVMAACPLVEVVQQLLGAPPAMLQSAYYESSRGTQTHLDFNPLDRERPMVGVWIALEDIAPGAGRFYVLPGSQHLPNDARMQRFAELAWASYRQAFVELEPAVAEVEAQALLAEIARDHQLEREVPALRRGDALFWTNRLLHGSEVPQPGGGTRHSLLLHFIEADLAAGA